MTSEKIVFGRRSRMLEIAADAHAILSSNTDQIDHSFWSSKTQFLENYPCFSKDLSWNDDDQDVDLMVLVVLDEFSPEALNEILRINEEVTDERYLWLADTYDTLPEWDPNNPPQGSSGPVRDDWRSPFIAASVTGVAAFIQAAHKPPKPLCKKFFAVLQKDRYERDNHLLIYKILDVTDCEDNEIRLQSVPCPAHLAGFFFQSYDRYRWDSAVEEQALYYGEGARWDDDSPGSQVMALVVLDDVSTETLQKVIDDNIEDTGHPHLWLADSLGNLPDYRPDCRIIGTKGPIDKGWRSPFAGKSIADAANFIRKAPKPPKPLNKRFFAVLQKDRFERTGKLLICKILPQDESHIDPESNEASGNDAYRKAGRSLVCDVFSGEEHDKSGDQGGVEVQMIEITYDHVGAFYSGFERRTWWELGEDLYD